ncbi:MAG: nuclear transport factor 2 family protein [Planctomycetota bacterium]
MLMPRGIARSFVVALAAAVLGACHLPSGFTAGDRSTIEGQAKAWADAVVAGDPDALLAIYEPEAVVMPEGRQPLIGTDAIGAFFAGMPDVKNVKLRVLEINGHGSLAYVVGRYRFAMAVEGEPEPVVDEGVYVEVWRRHGGRWLIARDIFHTTPVQEGEAPFQLAPPRPTPADVPVVDPDDGGD